MAKLLPNVPAHDGSKFNWTGRHGCADMSDFRCPLAGRLYADACDVGFVVTSGRTGRKVVFTQTAGPGEDSDGEVGSYDFTSAEGFRVTVFND